MSNYTDLLKKLDQFTRKFYLNKVIRGSLYSVGLILLLFLLFTFLEYKFYFPTGVRKGLFFGFLAVSAVSLFTWVISPLLHYFRLGKLISHEQAAEIIGTHFESVQDKLLNILQLKAQADKQSNSELVFASIEQKTEDIRLVPFKKAINLGNNRKYLRFALPPLLVLLSLLLIDASIIKDGTGRLIRNNEHFEKPAPYHFDIQNESLQAVQYEDYELKVTVDGSILPESAFIRIGKHEYKMSKKDRDAFSYTFKNIQASQSFEIFSGEITSRPYDLDVLAKPQITDIEMLLDYPSYTGRADESLRNAGDITIPVGTSIKWKVNTKNTGDLSFGLLSESNTTSLEQVGSGVFESQRRILKNDGYKLVVSNDLLPKADSVSYGITLIPDRYPTISAEKFVDSTDRSVAYFAGSSADDYGLAKITFNYEIRTAETQEVRKKEAVLLKTPGVTQASFDYLLEVDSFYLKPGEELSYYFETWDNDRVHGSKAARTSLMTFKKPSVEEYEAQADANSEAIKEELNKALKENKKVQDDLKELKEELLNKKELGWEDKKELEELMERQRAIQEQIQKAQQKFQENMQNQSEYQQTPEEMQEQQEQLDQMFEEAQSEEMQELMEKIRELMEEMKREEALEMMEEMELNQENQEMDMDRLLELYKQLEFEKEFSELADKLNELAEEQEKLSEETAEQAEQEEKEAEEKEGESEEQNGDEKESDEQSQEGDENEKGDKQDEGENKDGQKKQEDIQKAFEELMKDKEKLEEKNEELERPRPMEDSEEMEENIQQDMQQSMDQMKQGDQKKASEKQKDAAEKMQQMSEQMQSQMQGGQMEQMAEDMETLRQLLENLVNLSFDQEDLVNDFARTNAYVPRFAELVQNQDKIQRDFKMVEDTLQALSKRNDKISGFVTEKVREVKRNLGKTLDHLEEREKSQASDHQRRTMKNLNDLALMLNESMEQMQQQMAGMSKGNQMCNNPKPGAGGKPMDVISQGQKKLNEQMMQQAQERQKGKQMGSKEFAEMAAQQAAMRKMLQDLQKQKSEQGKADPEIQQIIDEMNKIETDLVNKQLTNEMLKRQQEILTRLLKAEKAERQRDWDNKREAETAQNKERQLPPALEKYIKDREAEIDYFKTVSPDMNPFFKSLVEQYYRSLKQ